MLNDIFGPSIHLLIFDMFLENSDKLMNLREIARMVDKNPGSVSRVIPILVENELLEQIKVGKKMYVYRLHQKNDVVKLIMDFYEKLKKLYENKK